MATDPNATQPARTQAEWTKDKVYSEFPKVPRDALYADLDQSQRAWFTRLESQTPNKRRCTFIKLNTYLLLCTDDDFKDVCDQFAEIGACGYVVRCDAR